MKLGIDALCLGWQGWDVFGILDYCARIGVDTVELARKQFESFDEDYLLQVRRRADELGLGLEVELGSIDSYATVFRHDLGSAEDQLRAMLPVAKILGASRLQCFLGSGMDRVGAVPFEQHVAEFLRVLQAVKPLLDELEIGLALENHQDFLARELKDLMEEVSADYLGVCLDTGNPIFMGEDPLLTTELLAPYIVMTHVRDSRVWAVPEGAMVQWVPLNEGYTDVPGIAALLAQHTPSVSFNLEIITGADPRLVEYASPTCELWRVYPEMLARDFLRFTNLAQHGEPEPLKQLIPPRGVRGLPEGELGEQLKAQQLRHHEDSVIYCREVLGLGERGK